MSSRVIRVIAYLAGVVALAMSHHLFQERRYIGFPDGFISEHDRVRKVLLAAAFAVSLLAGAGFVALGWRAPKRTGTKLVLAGLAYGIVIAVTLLVDQHLNQRSGIGG